MSEHRPRPFAVACPECDTRRTLADPNEALEIHRRHDGLTGHGVEWERAELGFEIPPGGVKTVLAALESEYGAGVPVGILTAAMSRRGVSIAETLDRVHDLRMSGELYEPRDDHLGVV